MCTYLRLPYKRVMCKLYRADLSADDIAGDPPCQTGGIASPFLELRGFSHPRPTLRTHTHASGLITLPSPIPLSLLLMIASPLAQFPHSLKGHRLSRSARRVQGETSWTPSRCSNVHCELRGARRGSACTPLACTVTSALTGPHAVRVPGKPYNWAPVGVRG